MEFYKKAILVSTLFASFTSKLSADTNKYMDYTPLKVDSVLDMNDDWWCSGEYDPEKEKSILDKIKEWIKKKREESRRTPPTNKGCRDNTNDGRAYLPKCK